MKFSGKLNTLSIGKETVFKTPVVTTALIPTKKQSAKLDLKYVDSETVTGSRAQSASVIVGSEGKLSVPMEVNLTSIGYFLAGALNDSISGSGPYTHTFTANTANTSLPSWTFLDSRGGYKNFQLYGSTLNTLSFEIAKDAIVNANAEYVYIGETDTAQSLIPGNVAIGTGIITLTNTFSANDPVKLFLQDGASTLPTGLSEGTVYYISAPTGTNFKLSLTSGGGAISSYISAGTGTFEIVKQEALTAPSSRVLGFKDSNAVTAVKVNAVNFGSLYSASISFDNKLDTSEKVLGGAGVINSVISPEFDVTGKITVNFNTESAYLRTKYANASTTSLQLELWEDATYGLRFFFPAVQLKGGDISYEDGGITQSFDFMGTGATPVTVTLINGKSTAY